MLTPAWRGWCVRDGTLVDPEGNETSQGQLRSYFMVLQWVAAVASRDLPETLQQYYDLLRRA